jgi:gluconolactonase
MASGKVGGESPTGPLVIGQNSTRLGFTCLLFAMLCIATAHAQPTAQFERLDPRLDALIPRSAVIEELADGIRWAEGPLWNARDKALLFSDVASSVILRWKEGENLSPFMQQTGGGNGLAFDAQGRLVFCQETDRRVMRRNEDGNLSVMAERYEGKRFNGPNDLVHGPGGSLYFTDPPFGLGRAGFNSPASELGFSGVYRLTPEGKLSLVTSELQTPNGIAFSPDGKTLYVTNMEQGRAVWMAYPANPDGSVGTGRRFAEASVRGDADGMKVDAAGNVFATGPGGVHIFAPDGTRLGRILTGQPTANVAWGDDGTVLYITANHKLLRVRTTTRGMAPLK